MTVTLELSPELEARLREEAAQRHLDVSTYAVDVLAQKMNVAPTDQSQRPKRSLMELHGLGAELWKDIDVEKYINNSRDEWDSHMAL